LGESRRGRRILARRLDSELIKPFVDITVLFAEKWH
jgi:hypothetical protein